MSEYQRYIDETGVEPLTTEACLEEVTAYLKIIRKMHPSLDMGEDFEYILASAEARVAYNKAI